LLKLPCSATARKARAWIGVIALIYITSLKF